MDVADHVADGGEGGRNVFLLDIHVKQIAEKLCVGDALLAEECRRVGLAVEEVRLVAVERLVEQHLAVPAGPGPEVVQ